MNASGYSNGSRRRYAAGVFNLTHGDESTYYPRMDFRNKKIYSFLTII